MNSQLKNIKIISKAKAINHKKLIAFILSIISKKAKNYVKSCL